MTDRIEAIRARLEAEIASEIESRVRAAKGDVRCLDCNMRYEERQEYGCHVPGHGHDYDEGDFAGAEEIERSKPVEYVTLSVADLRRALAPVAPDAEPACTCPYPSSLDTSTLDGPREDCPVHGRAEVSP